jgi:hypothetical protein
MFLVAAGLVTGRFAYWTPSALAIRLGGVIGALLWLANGLEFFPPACGGATPCNAMLGVGASLLVGLALGESVGSLFLVGARWRQKRPIPQPESPNDSREPRGRDAE